MLPQIKKFIQYFIVLLLIPVLLFAAYLWAALTWTYSSGERAGYVQKLSQKGWVCKTFEGALILVSMPGTQAEKFPFTVRSKQVAEKINQTIGQRVRLIYEEHKGLPTTCFGDTAYFVTDVQPLDQKLDQPLDKAH